MIRLIVLTLMLGAIRPLAASGSEPLTAPTTNSVVTSARQADASDRKTVTVIGTARSGKVPNVQVSPDFYVRCVGMIPRWPDDIVGKRVKVTGFIEKHYAYDTNLVSKGTIAYVMRNCKWELKNPQPASGDYRPEDGATSKR